MRRLVLTAAVLFCAGISLLAAPLTVSTSGTFSAGVPTTSWTAPSTPWSLSFSVSSNPTVLTSSAGVYTRIQFTNFSYQLNGVTVAVNPTDIAFYSSSQGGLLNIALLGSAGAPNTSPTNGFVILGPQAYSGTEAAPTILANTYTETGNTVDVGGTAFPQTVGTVLIANAVVTTPVPPSLWLTLLGLMMMTAYFTSRRSVKS